MGIWNKSNIPHKGWQCIDCLDLGEAIGVCEMCSKEKIRFIHIMQHPNFPSIRVGCICASKMELEPDLAPEREKRLRNKARRKQKFLTREWKVSQKGHLFLNIRGTNVGIICGPRGGFKFRIGGRFGEKWYKTADQAKLALFQEAFSD